VLRRVAAPVSALALWLSAVAALAEVPECLLVEARSAPSANGTYDHSLTFINGCDVRIYLAARYSGEPDSTAGRELVGKGDSVTIPLGFSQPTNAFRAHYEVRFGQSSSRSRAKPATGAVGATSSESETRTSRSTAPRAKTPPRSLGSSASLDASLSLAKLCDRAVRKLFRVQGVSENDSGLKDRVANCPSRVKRDPQKRRAELECVLAASTREDVRTCFGAK
jgi:hypothetical protein